MLNCGNYLTNYLIFFFGRGEEAQAPYLPTIPPPMGVECVGVECVAVYGRDLTMLLRM